MTLRSLLFLLLSVFSITLQAQLITISEQEGSEPLEGVTLLSDDPKAFAVTNLYGKADLSEFQGSQLIQIRSLGYESINISYDELKEKNFELELKAGNLQLDEVVISASRWKQSTSNVASSISSIKPRDIQLQNPQTAADMLALSGKVFVQKSQQGGGSPMIRGFATNRLLYSVDGVRMNTAIFRGGNIQNVINLDPYTLEKTEVLFGPSSVSYGSDAIGGVMSFQTYEPQFSLEDKSLIKGSVSSRYSSANNEVSGHIDLNIGFKKWALYSSFSNWNYGDLRQGSHGPDDYVKDYHVDRLNGQEVLIRQGDELLQVPSAYSQNNFLQKIRFKPNDKWDLSYSFNYSETTSYGRYDRHNRMRNGLPRYAEWDYGPQKWMMNLLSIEHESDAKVFDEMAIRIAQQNFQESRISRDLFDDERDIREEEVDAYSINLDFNKRIGANHTLFYGAEYVFNDVSSDGMIENIITTEERTGPSRYPDSKWSSAALFLSDEYRINEQFNLLGGVRYNYYQLEADFSDNLAFYPFPYKESQLENEAITASLGAVYRPNDKWVLRTNAGTAFRAPNVDDIGKVFDSEPGAVLVPNPDLKAEYAYNLDIGVAKVFDDLLKIEVTAFYTLLENAMVRRDYQLNGLDSIQYDGELSQVQAIQNAAEANVYGVQFGLELQFLNNFKLSTDLNYQVGEEETDDGVVSPSRHAAPLFGVSRLTYERKKTRLQFYVEFQDEFKADELAISERSKTEIYALDNAGNSYAPSWYTFNLKAQHNFSSHFSLATGIENIADLRYRPYSSGISAPGRNFYVSLTAKM